MNLDDLNWNWNLFSTVGYAGVGVALFVLFLWLIHFVFKVKPFICHFALVLAVAAFVLAKINSLTHVNLIQLDPAAQKAAFEAQQAAKREALLDSRGEDVAQIRFAEDGTGDFLDRAGMDDTDLKYFDKQLSGEPDNQGEDDTEPEWKKEKKNRSGAKGESEGMKSEELEKVEEAEPILVPEAEMTMANQMDYWTLRITRWFIFLGVGIVILDHLRRANRYRDAYYPLPLSSSAARMMSPFPPVVVRPDRPRRNMPKELAWLLKRGDSFIYLTDDKAAADTAMKKLSRFEKRRRRPVEILRIGEAELEFSDDFAFETWWYGRASIVIDNSERAGQMVASILERLEQRKQSRAGAARTPHLVWDLSEPISPAYRAAFERLAKRTGVSLFLCRTTTPSIENSQPEPTTFETPQTA